MVYPVQVCESRMFVAERDLCVVLTWGALVGSYLVILSCLVIDLY